MQQPHETLSDAVIMKHMTYVGIVVFVAALGIAWIANTVA